MLQDDAVTIEPTGTEETRAFYDAAGWHTNSEGETVDADLFGVKEDGPIRVRLQKAVLSRILAPLAPAQGHLDMLECGCGGAPAEMLLPHCASYTGVDFSKTGIELATRKFSGVKTPHSFQVADVCALPFPDASFDAIYSAHMLYHIEDAHAQRKALGEMLRVLRPGGTLILHLANPHPFLFPIRALMRLIANTPALARPFRKLRGASPLPYNPQTIHWTRDVLTECSAFHVATGGMASTKFNQSVSEHRFPGKLLWKCIEWLELSHPVQAAYLGNYVVYVCQK